MFLDEKAVQFAQAEKLYYESALINSASATPSRNPLHNSVRYNNKVDVNKFLFLSTQSTNNQYIQKANEYEQLASLCLKQHK